MVQLTDSDLHALGHGIALDFQLLDLVEKAVPLIAQVSDLFASLDNLILACTLLVFQLVDVREAVVQPVSLLLEDASDLGHFVLK